MSPSAEPTNEDTESYETIEGAERYDSKVKPSRVMMEAQLIDAVKQLAAESTRLRDKMDTSKTSTKRKYYSKKLGKNNDILADMLMRLDHLQKQKQDVPDES